MMFGGDSKSRVLIAVALLLVAIVLAAGWAIGGGFDGDEVDGAPTVSDQHLHGPKGDAATGEPEAIPDSPNQRRELHRSTASPKPADAAAGSLRVLVRAGDTEQPLRHVSVIVEARTGNSDTERHGRLTDEWGVAVFESLLPGRVSIRVDRWRPNHEPVLANVESGQQTEIEIHIGAGVDALVKVFDGEGAAVPGAEVLLWPASGLLDAPSASAGYVVGTTDDAGSLELRRLVFLAFGSHSSWVAARHPRRGASIARMVPAPIDSDDSAIREIELQLGSVGSMVSIEVLDWDGAPLDGATVLGLPVDEPDSVADGQGRSFAFVSRATKTGDNGLCDVGPFPEGEWRFEIRAAGAALQIERLTLDGVSPSRLEVRLTREALVTGRVVAGPDEAPLGGARLRLRQGDCRVDLRSGDDGRFVVHGLQAGSFRWEVSRDGYDHESGDGIAPTELNIGMLPLASLRLQCVDERGNGVRGLDVVLAGDDDGRTDWQRGRLDDEGRLELSVCADIEYALRITEPGVALPLPLDAGVRLRARAEPWRVVVPDASRASAHLTGSLLDSAGEPAVAGCTFALEGVRSEGFHSPPRSYAGKRGVAIELDPSTGRFELGPMPPGRYVLEIMDKRSVSWRLPPVEVRGGERVDLGQLRVPETGTLIVELERDGDFAITNLTVQIDRGGRNAGLVRIDPETGRGELQVLPGRCSVTVFGGGFRWVSRELEVVAGETERLHSVLQRARRFGVRVPLPEGESALRWELHDARGELIMDGQSDGPDEWGHPWWPFLDVGEFFVTATGSSGRRYHANFRVDSLEPTDAVLDLKLRSQR